MVSEIPDSAVAARRQMLLLIHLPGTCSGSIPHEIGHALDAKRGQRGNRKNLMNEDGADLDAEFTEVDKERINREAERRAE